MHACLQEEEEEEEEEEEDVFRRRSQAFYDCGEDDLREIVSAIVANRIIGHTIQHRSVRVRNSRFKLSLNLTFAPNL